MLSSTASGFSPNRTGVRFDSLNDGRPQEIAACENQSSGWRPSDAPDATATIHIACWASRNSRIASSSSALDRSKSIPQANAQGMGIIVKRPIGNGVWGVSSSPRPYADEYFARAEAMGHADPLENAPENGILVALGFVLAHDISTAIVGTHNPRHMQMNLDWVKHDLPIAPELVAALQHRFEAHQDNWRQLT